VLHALLDPRRDVDAALDALRAFAFSAAFLSTSGWHAPPPLLSTW
jgi:hypothetical protein